MILSDVRNKKDFIKYMKPFGNHVLHILGNYYAISNVNTSYDIYEIVKYDEPYYKKNSKRLINHGCEPIETIKVGSEECVRLIIKEVRKEKLNKIYEKSN